MLCDKSDKCDKRLAFVAQAVNLWQAEFQHPQVSGEPLIMSHKTHQSPWDSSHQSWSLGSKAKDCGREFTTQELQGVFQDGQTVHIRTIETPLPSLLVPSLPLLALNSPCHDPK